MGAVLIFILLALLWVVLIVPRQREVRRHNALVASLQVGDEVMTASGMYGFVTLLEGDIAWLEIDDDVQIRIARAALQRKVDTGAGDTADPIDDGSGRGTKIEPSDGAAADEPSK